MIPVHAERVPGEPDALLWHLPEVQMPTGLVRSAPGALGVLLTEGTITEATLARGLLWLAAPGPGTWARIGPDVRTALGQADDGEAWVIQPAATRVVGRVAGHVVGVELDAYLASHGGRLEVAAATGSEVAVRTGGACTGCPALRVTLTRRVEQRINARLDHPVRVVPG